MSQPTTVAVTLAEIARIAGVGRAAVSNWRRRHDTFPTRIGGTDASPQFSLVEVDPGYENRASYRGGRSGAAVAAVRLIGRSSGERPSHRDDRAERQQRGATVVSRPTIDLSRPSQRLVNQAGQLAEREGAKRHSNSSLVGGWIPMFGRSVQPLSRWRG